jgi:hypothetical protein
MGKAGKAAIAVLIAFVLGVVGGTAASYATDDYDPTAPLVMEGSHA